jgi:hypothetical protein
MKLAAVISLGLAVVTGLPLMAQTAARRAPPSAGRCVYVASGGSNP